MSGSDGSPFQPVNAAADTIGAVGTITSPGAGGVIATVTSPSAGIYQVAVQALVAGTYLPADIPNVRLTRSITGTVVVPLLTAAGMDATMSQSPAGILIPRVTLLNAQSLRVVTIAAGTAGSVYFASIMITQIG